MPQKHYDLNRFQFRFEVNEEKITEIVNSLDSKNRWLSSRAYISNPYIGDGVKKEQTDKYASTHVGDETDTSPYRNTSDQKYISTGEYIKNMKFLINYLNSSSQ